MKLQTLLEDRSLKKLALKLQQEAIELLDDSIDVSIRTEGGRHCIKINSDLMKFGLYLLPLYGGSDDYVSISTTNDRDGYTHTAPPDQLNVETVFLCLQGMKSQLGPVFSEAKAHVLAAGYWAELQTGMSHDPLSIRRHGSGKQAFLTFTKLTNDKFGLVIEDGDPNDYGSAARTGDVTAVVSTKAELDKHLTTIFQRR